MTQIVGQLLFLICHEYKTISFDRWTFQDFLRS